MDERIQELARQVWPDPNISHVNHMKFAELIIRECISIVENLPAGYKDYRNQIEDAFRRDCITELKAHFGVNE